MAKAKNLEKEARELLEELFTLLGVEVEFEISLDKEGETLEVDMQKTQNTGLLIGKHGDTLLALQAFLGMALRQKKGEAVRVLMNIGDWRQKQEEHLISLAQSAAQRAKETGEPQTLYNLKPYQRRIVHLTLAEDREVKTESQGEGQERYLVVNPK